MPRTAALPPRRARDPALGASPDDEDVGLREAREVARGREAGAPGKVPDAGLAEVREVAAPVRELGDLRLVAIEPEDRQATGVKGVTERQADVAEPDHADRDVPIADPPGER